MGWDPQVSCRSPLSGPQALIKPFSRCFVEGPAASAHESIARETIPACLWVHAKRTSGTMHFTSKWLQQWRNSPIDLTSRGSIFSFSLVKVNRCTHIWLYKIRRVLHAFMCTQIGSIKWTCLYWGWRFLPGSCPHAISVYLLWMSEKGLSLLCYALEGYQEGYTLEPLNQYSQCVRFSGKVQRVHINRSPEWFIW